MAVTLGGASSYVTSGLVLYLDAARSASYPGSGTTWTDLSSSGNNGTLYGGMSYSNGKMMFDGSSGYVSVGSTGLANFTGGITISFMANMTATSGSWCRFMDFGNGPDTNNILFARYGGLTYMAGSQWKNTAAAAWGYSTIDNTLQLGNNACYTITGDGTNNKLYINGVLIGTQASTLLPDNVTRTINYIGRSNWAGDAYYQGSMSAIQIYNRAITLAEVQQNYAYLSQGIMLADGTIQGSKFDTTNDTGQLLSTTSFATAGAATWTKPTGCTKVIVKVVAGGGGGAGHCESGGAGGYSEKVIDVTAVASVAVTVGAGGAATGYYAAAPQGGTSSFGAYCSATGGYGANQNASHTGGHGGVGSSGDINFLGGTGTGHSNNGSQQSPGRGAPSYWGGSSGQSHNNSNPSNIYYMAPGSGGTGGNQGYGYRAGGDGLVVVYAYK